MNKILSKNNMPWTREFTRAVGNTALNSAKVTGVLAGAKIAEEYARKVWKKQQTPKPKQVVQVKTKKRNQRIVTNSNTEVKFNKNTVVLNRKQPKGRTAGKWKFVQITQRITRSVSGVQGVNKILEVCSKTAGLWDGTDPNVTGSSTISLINLADMNPYRKITGSALHSAGAMPSLDKYMIKSIDIELEVVNAENTPCVFDLYFVTRKQTSAIQFDQSWAQALADEAPAGQGVTSYPGPGQVVPTSGKSGGYSKIDFPGDNPFSSKVMRQNWRLLKKRSVNMAVGVNEIIRTRIAYNKIINMASLLLIDDANHIANTTIEVWCVQRGVTVFDHTVTPAPKVTYNLSTLGFVQRVQYNMCAVYSNAGRINVTYVGSNIPANAARNLMLHVDEDSEVPITSLSAVP